MACGEVFEVSVRKRCEPDAEEDTFMLIIAGCSMHIISVTKHNLVLSKEIQSHSKNSKNLQVIP